MIAINMQYFKYPNFLSKSFRGLKWKRKIRIKN